MKEETKMDTVIFLFGMIVGTLLTGGILFIIFL